jgi:phosphoglycerate dehydrogenase-like enzyme
MPPVVVVTEPEYRRGEPVFASAADARCVPCPPAEQDVAAAVRRTGARHAIVGSVPYRGPLYDALGRGAVLARYGVGHESIDKARATAAGVLCTNTPDVLQQSVAELTMTLVGAAARHVLPLAGGMQAGRWEPRQGRELSGRTLAILGCGEIGRAVARIAAAGYGMRVVGYRRRPGAPAAGDLHFERFTESYEDAVAEADFVSLHIPGSAENVRFLDGGRLAVIPSRAWLVNTARGAVVDEGALFEALEGGRLAGAALDVFEREPYEPGERSRDLRRLANVIALPHVGSNTADANRRMAERALRNIRLAEAGDASRMDLLNPEVL